jgi:hypothetical protein
MSFLIFFRWRTSRLRKWISFAVLSWSWLCGKDNDYFAKNQEKRRVFFKTHLGHAKTAAHL